MVLGDFSAYNFHRHWPVVTILGWNGTRYRDVTRRYPERSRQQAQERQKDILASLRIPARERHEWDFQDKITAYYANMLAIRQGQKARLWLKSHLPVSEWKWIQRHDHELRRLMSVAAQRRTRVSQKTIIKQQ